MIRKGQFAQTDTQTDAQTDAPAFKPFTASQ